MNLNKSPSLLSLKKCNQTKTFLTKYSNEQINGEFERNTIQANC
jgi:hypothetical protein